MGADVVIPLVGMLTGVLVTGALAWGLVNIFRGPVGQAMARRIHGASAGDPELASELYQLKSEVDQLQHRLSEAEERLDFSERLLAQKSEDRERQA